MSEQKTGSLTLQQIAELLSLAEPIKNPSYPPLPKQHGPLRYFDNELRCASRGCGTVTHYKVKGVPYCAIHSLRLMNDMLAEYEEKE
jgi:hypothetical protein